MTIDILSIIILFTLLLKLMLNKILILGSTGMLGNAVSHYFLFQDNYNTQITHRNKSDTKWIYYNPLENVDFYGNYDYVINCIGIIKPFIGEDKAGAIVINSLFPHQLAYFCKKKGCKLIHITTDCVYSGSRGSYAEDDSHDALDFYGKSKSLGEPDNAMVIRTSIIGEEVHKFASLISWVKSMKGKEVSGYTNHWWNGITTNQYAKICDKIMSQNLYEEGLFHIFSTTVNKHEMLQEFNSKWDLSLKIKEFQTDKPVDRTLSTTKDLNSKLEIPSFKEMVRTL